MSKYLLAGLLLASCGICRASDVPLEVYISGVTPQVDSQALVRAQFKSAAILKHNHIAVKWFRGKPPHCTTGRPIRLVLDIVQDAPSSVGVRALASTIPALCPAPTIQLYWNRISVLMQNLGPAQKIVLGFVVTHELVHALTGSKHHDKEGVMKAEWSPEDVRDMGNNEGNFADVATFDLMSR